MSWYKYLLALAITAAIFGTAFYVAYRFNEARVADIRSTEESISIDILSSETQFELLGSLDCSLLTNPEGSGLVLSDELNSLAAQLSVAEQNLGTNDPQVIQLKEQYSLLEIKDYVLLEQLKAKCGLKPVFILYFYSNAGDCPECSEAGDVLTYLRQEYPGLRVYSFDYHLNISALQTLISLHHVDGTNLPAFIIDDRPTVYGFKTLDQLQALIPELQTLATSSAATSTAGF